MIAASRVSTTKARLLRLMGTSLTAMVAFGSPAFSQPTQETPAPSDQTAADAQERDVVVITARKTEEQAIDIPTAVTVVTGESIDEAGGIQDMRSLTLMLPGVSLVDNDSENSEFAIRGAGQAGRSINADAAIALLRNGAQVTGGNIGGRGYARMDYFDLERIEVLRGAQGSLYGANAVGGVVSIVSQAPTDEFEGKVALRHNLTTVGLDGSAIVNVPINDVLSTRFGIELEEDFEGQVYNSYRDEYADATSYRGARASLRFEPSDTLKLTMFVDGSRLDGYNGGQTNVQHRRYYNIPETWDYQEQVEGDANAKFRQNVFNLALIGEADLGFAELTSTTNYRWRDSFSIADDDGRYPGAPPLASTGLPNIAGGANCRLNTCFSRYADQVTVLFQELLLSGSNDLLEWQLGTDFRQLNDDYSISNFGRQRPGVIVPPQFQILLSENATYGAFATTKWRLTDTLSAEFSGRWTQDRKEFQSGLSSGTPQVGGTPARDRTYVNWTYGGALSWRPDVDTNLYARVATGFRAGGFNRDVGTNPDLPGNPTTPGTYGEESTNAYEIGAKRFFDRGLQVSAALFFSEYLDVLVVEQGVRSVSQGGGTYNYLDNFGDADAAGLEVEATGAFRSLAIPGDRLRYTLSGTWFDSKLTSIIASVDGSQLNGTADFALSASGSYSWPVFGEMEAFFAPSFEFADGGYFNLTNSIETATLRNLRVRAGIRSKDGWEVALSGSNILDQKYPFRYAADYVIERPGSEFSVEFRYAFD